MAMRRYAAGAITKLLTPQPIMGNHMSHVMCTIKTLIFMNSLNVVYGQPRFTFGMTVMNKGNRFLLSAMVLIRQYSIIHPLKKHWNQCHFYSDLLLEPWL